MGKRAVKIFPHDDHDDALYNVWTDESLNTAVQSW